MTASLAQLLGGVGVVLLVGMLIAVVDSNESARVLFADRPNVSGTEEAVPPLGTCVPPAGFAATQEGGTCHGVMSGAGDELAEDDPCFCYSFAYVHHGSVAAKSVVLDIARRAGVPTDGDCAALADACDGGAEGCTSARVGAYMRCGDGKNKGIIGFDDKHAMHA